VLQTNEDTENLVAALRGAGHFARRSTAEFMAGGIQPPQGFVCPAEDLRGSQEQSVGGLDASVFNLREIQADDDGYSPAVGKLNRPVEVSVRGHRYNHANANQDQPATGSNGANCRWSGILSLLWKQERDKVMKRTSSLPCAVVSPSFIP